MEKLARRVYTAEFRQQAVEMITCARLSIPQASGRLAISAKTLLNRVRRARSGDSPTPAPSECSARACGAATWSCLTTWEPHRASRIEEVAAARGARASWLPPYSPDYSPIEQCRSKIKSYPRGAKARTRERLEEALAAALGLATKADIRGWLTSTAATR